MSLQQFLVANRLDLISRTRAMVAKRSTPSGSEGAAEGEGHGVPQFLSQLVAALEDDTERNPEKKASKSMPPPNSDIARSAILHGQGMRKLGFTVEEVVREYGDICQAVTELADERDAEITTNEFHILNRCLDDAIARAVASWTVERDQSQAGAKGHRDRVLSNLVFTVTVSFDALRSGRVGTGGATATVIVRCLTEMRSLLDDSTQASR